MSRFSFAPTNLQEAIMVLERAPLKGKEELDKAIKKSAMLGTRKIKKETPVDTGTLKRGIRPEIYPLKAKIKTHNAPYAIYVHEGTRYMQGQPFMEEGMRNAEDQIEGFFEEAVDNVLDYLSDNSI